MNSVPDIIHQYFDAWNRHDPAAIVACFTENGSYRDPAIPCGIAGDALADYTGRLFAALPDVRFDIAGTAEGSDGRTVVEWQMVASPAVSLPGVDLIAVEDSRILSVQGYYDRQTLSQQLGNDN